MVNIGLACDQEVRPEGALRRASCSYRRLRSAFAKEFVISNGFLKCGSQHGSSSGRGSQFGFLMGFLISSQNPLHSLSRQFAPVGQR